MSNVKHFQKRETTSITKTFHGWQGKTTLNVNNQDWVIITMKRSSGKIVSSAQAVKGNENGSFMYEVFGDKSITLLSIEKNATESAIKAAHYEALAKFDAMQEANELPENSVYEIKPGQLFRFDGYGFHMEVKYVVYEVINGDYGNQYKCIDLIDNSFTVIGQPKLVSEVFGIGTYYNEGEMMDMDQLNDLIIEANQLAQTQEQKRKDKEIDDATLKAESIIEGSKIISAIPEGTKALIIGEYMQDDSDPMSDYFSCHRTKTIFLAFSTHTRDSFEEMRKAAVNSDLTKHLENGEEHREKYAGGQGYYIGGYRSGWRVSKMTFTDHSTVLEMLQMAVAAGLYFIPSEPIKQQDSISKDIKIVDYSEKAFAVIGNTKPIKDQLKALGGKFNFRLSCGAGWIFSKKQLATVQNFLA